MIGHILPCGHTECHRCFHPCQIRSLVPLGSVAGSWVTSVLAVAYWNSAFLHLLLLLGLAPLCENMPSGKANKPGDVVKAKNGKTIQVCRLKAWPLATFSGRGLHWEKPKYHILRP